MNEQAGALKILLRRPSLPAIIISKNELFLCTDMGMLAVRLTKAEPAGLHVHVVDSAGDEFWHIPERRILAPGFTFRKWTKRGLIDLVNSSSNVARLGVRCSIKGLSNRLMGLMISILAYPAGRARGTARR